jgi:plasmid stabilization system protein ParE
LSREIVLSRRARRQLFTALDWWYSHRDKAPNAFEEDLNATWELLSSTPAIGKAVSARRPGVRRVLMERVRYYVYYRVTASGVVEITAIWHSSRRPPVL